MINIRLKIYYSLFFLLTTCYQSCLIVICLNVFIEFQISILFWYYWYCIFENTNKVRCCCITFVPKILFVIWYLHTYHRVTYQTKGKHWNKIKGETWNENGFWQMIEREKSRIKTIYHSQVPEKLFWQKNNNNNKLFQFLVWNYYRSSYYFLSSILHYINKYQSKIEWSLFSAALWKFFKDRKGLYFQKNKNNNNLYYSNRLVRSYCNKCVSASKSEEVNNLKGIPRLEKIASFFISRIKLQQNLTNWKEHNLLNKFIYILVTCRCMCFMSA
jgi:hypothetical protein